MTRWRPLTWLLLSMVCFLGALLFWRLGERWQEQKSRTPQPPEQVQTNSTAKASQIASQSFAAASTAPVIFGADPSGPSSSAAAAPDPLKYRVSNTARPLGELLRDDRAILLAN